MKVAYVFITPRAATYKLGQMILPQLEAGVHGVEVVGMFFFDDNAFVLRKGDLIGERLAKIAKEKNILLSCLVARTGMSVLQAGKATPRTALHWGLG